MGGIYSTQTRFVGTVILTEGQTFTERHEDYLATSEAPMFFENHQFFKIRLDKVAESFKDGLPLNLICRIKLEDGARTGNYVVRINQPFEYKKTNFLIHNHGYAPHFVITNRTGNEVFHSYVNLYTTAGVPDDHFNVPGTDLAVYVRLFPDAELRGERLREVSRELKNPAMRLRIIRQTNEGVFKETLYNGHAFKNEAIKFDNYVLSYDDIRHWVRFEVRKDRGVPIIFAGFWVGIFGLCVRFLASFIRWN
ncbi:MAG: cytochrome c biogenesis protein ResB [bacterium]